MYPGDWVQLDTLVPTSQGVGGVFGGQTLGATDYIECELFITTSLGCGTLCLGVLMGAGIGSVSDWETVTGQVLADQDICVIQSKGIHPQGAQADTGILGDYLSASSTAGEPINDVSGTTTDSLRSVGVVMISSTTYTRATAADTHGSVVYVDC